MCVICNLTIQGYETAYLAVDTEASESILTPVVNRLLDFHTYQACLLYTSPSPRDG